MATANQPEARPPEDEPRTDVFLESRYRKLHRGIPQTVFFCPRCKGHARRRKKCKTCHGFGKLTKTSVQELIERRLRPTMRAKRTVFHGAGREDLDVLMLGRGRPFVVEVVGAREPSVNLLALRDEIVDRAEGAIELDPFVQVDRERIAFWKQGVFAKEYRVEAALGGVVPDAAVAGLVGNELQLTQRTPQRVAHRRADLERERQLKIQSARRMDVVADEADRIEIQIQCEHGTYVKEWVSGDEGRTKPSLADRLGVTAECALLDVQNILVD